LEFKSAHFFYAMGAVTFLLLIFDEGTMEVPTLATSSAFFLFLLFAADQSWKAFKMHGRAAIVTSLNPDDGGHSTIHPDDISIAVSPSPDDDLPNFVVFATGGFVHGGVEWQGQDNFFVCPPEHVDQTGAALICHTKFRKIEFNDLHDYVQSELLKLKYFSPRMAKLQGNLWFGMTSKIDGTSTAKMLAAESSFLDQTNVINQLKKLLRDKNESNKKEAEHPFILNIPERAR